MRILYLCQLVPYPPDAGPKVRAYYTLRCLAQRHEVTLLAFSRPDDFEGAEEHLRSFCAEVYSIPIQRSQLRNVRDLLVSLAMGSSFVIQRDFVPKMAASVDNLLSSGRFAAVHADQLWMAQYALRTKRLEVGGLNIKTTLDEHNACFQIVQRLTVGEGNPLKRWVLEHEWRALQRFEARVLAQFDKVVTVTDEDQQTLKALLAEQFWQTGNGDQQSEFNDHKFTTIPICVDTQAIRPVTPQAGASNVLHLGVMYWPPNVEGVLWFARRVWPKVMATMPGATLTIAGKNPPTDVQALERCDIQVTGYVSDLLPYLEQAGVFIVPLFSGSGMRVKIIDAWRWGLPVVSTSIGAEGIQYRNGENILIADDAEAFAAAVLCVLNDPLLAQSLRVNGRRCAEAHYDWQRVYPAWEAIYPVEENRAA